MAIYSFSKNMPVISLIPSIYFIHCFSASLSLAKHSSFLTHWYLTLHAQICEFCLADHHLRKTGFIWSNINWSVLLELHSILNKFLICNSKAFPNFITVTIRKSTVLTILIFLIEISLCCHKCMFVAS